MPFQLSIPGADSHTNITIQNGTSVIFVGANGGGKSRLAAFIESNLALNAHRISAHRALKLNPRVPKISEAEALSGLRTGYAGKDSDLRYRDGQRWQNNTHVSLLNDYDYLVQALFADQANVSLVTHQKARGGNLKSADPTKFEALVEIWDRILPHRKLHISGDSIDVSFLDSSVKYPGSEMSDGERAIFYMIGQTLCAADKSLLIFDEPELHVHRSIMAKLWDELESARQDCGFIYISHDLEFAASRSAQKYFVRDYVPDPRWTIEAVPEETGFDESIATLILGSRKPVLFVEGTDTSLDKAIYRCCFPGWTVIPRGSCENVIHSVVTMRGNASLTRVTCSGIVDADDYQPDDIAYLAQLGIKVLPVSEIENVILLPSVSRAIAEIEGYEDEDLQQRLDDLSAAIFRTLTPATIEKCVVQYCRRRIDRMLKKVDLSDAADIATIVSNYGIITANIDIAALARDATERIENAIRQSDLPSLLANYDNKGLMALASAYLKKSRLQDFESWLTRVLRSGKAPALTTAIRDSLPTLDPR